MMSRHSHHRRLSSSNFRCQQDPFLPRSKRTRGSTRRAQRTTPNHPRKTAPPVFGQNGIEKKPPIKSTTRKRFGSLRVSCGDRCPFNRTPDTPGAEVSLRLRGAHGTLSGGTQLRGPGRDQLHPATQLGGQERDRRREGAGEKGF